MMKKIVFAAVLLIIAVDFGACLGIIAWGHVGKVRKRNYASTRTTAKKPIVKVTPANNQQACSFNGSAQYTSYNIYTDTATSVWSVDCQEAPIQNPCEFNVIAYIFKENPYNGQWPYMGKVCVDYTLDCGGNNPSFTSAVSGFRATYGPGNFQITWVLNNGACPNFTNTASMNQGPFASFFNPPPPHPEQD